MSNEQENTRPTENEEYIVFWEAPKIETPEFRLYYKEDGSVDFYTCEKLEGNYIVITQLEYAEARPDVKVVDGKISKVRPGTVSQKYIKHDDGHQLTCFEDISIIASEKTTVKTQYWKLETYEL